MVRNFFSGKVKIIPPIDIPSGFLPPEDIGRELYRCVFCGLIEFDEIRAHLYVNHRRDLMRLIETKGHGFMDYAVSECKKLDCNLKLHTSDPSDPSDPSDLVTE